MPRGYRCIVLAAFGCLILGNAEKQGRQDQHRSDAQQAAYPATVKQLPQTANTDRANQYCHGTSKPWLSCDAIAAQAAIDQARDADKQAALLWPQFGVGALTLLAAGLAAFFAWRAAKETARGAAAAEEAITVARQVGAAQVPAYLSISSVEIQKYSGIPVFVITVNNSGQSPAMDMMLLWRIAVGNVGNSIAPPFTAEFKRWGAVQGDMAASGEAELPAIPCKEIDTVEIGLTHLQIILGYNDVFDIPQKATATFHAPWGKSVGETPVEMTSLSNFAAAVEAERTRRGMS